MVFKVNPQAKIDIQDQIQYYNTKQKGLGKRFYDDVNHTFRTIKNNPFYQIRYKNVRCIPLKTFPAMVHFTLDEPENHIIIRAVFHTSQDSQKWNKR